MDDSVYMYMPNVVIIMKVLLAYIVKEKKKI